MALKRKASDGNWSTIGGREAGDFRLLGDVDTTGLVDGCTVRYDSGSSKWKPMMYIDDTGAESASSVWSSLKVKSITDALTSVAHIEVVTALPVPPVNNTMYYVGTASPYQIFLRANDITYNMGTTSISLAGYEKTENKVTVLSSAVTDTQYPSALVTYNSINAKQDKAVAHTATLTAAGWNATTKQQTVSVLQVTATNHVLVTPSPASYVDYNDAYCRCISQAVGTLTFQCEDIPTSDLTANVLILEE